MGVLIFTFSEPVKKIERSYLFRERGWHLGVSRKLFIIEKHQGEL
jgi:hypothetical protein